MKSEIVTAQLSIVDGAWQEAPDNLACFDAASLFEGNVERGNLYIVVEVAGESEGRDTLARELIETTRREYAALRGSIALGLMQAIRAANDFLYTANVNIAPEARRIAGVTTAIQREDELFIAQGGPGLTCFVRGNTLTRYPADSPWFNADEAAVSEWLGSRNFTSPGQVPIGMRHNYTPEVFHVTLRPGDGVVLATRALAHLLTGEELVDTLANRHPDEIVAGLEDLAGTADISAIVLRVAGETPAPTSALPSVPVIVPASSLLQTEKVVEPVIKPVVEPAIVEMEPPSPVVVPLPPSEEELTLQRMRAEREQERLRLQEEQNRERQAKIRSGVFRAGAGAVGILAGITGRINWTSIGNSADRAISAVLRGAARVIVFLIRAIIPGEPKDDQAARQPSPTLQTAWKLAALVLPILLIAAGIGMWGIYRTDQRAALERKVTQLLNDSAKALEEAKRLERTDRTGARDAAQNALKFAEQARVQSPNDPRVNNAYYPAQDFLDGLNGVSVIFSLPTFATFSEPKSRVTRLVPHWPDLFILDRGLQRVYRFTINDLGSNATPVAGDGVILRSGDRIDNRTVGDIFDLVWLDAGRLVALDRNGAYFQFDPARAVWMARGVNDPAAWLRATLATTYANNLYLIDAPRNQILKYVSPGADVTWSSAVTYFSPGVTPPDLTTVADLAIDGEVWLIRTDGSVSRFYDGRPKDIAFSGLDTPLARPIGICTSEKMGGLYIADAGNQRIVQFDKGTGRFARQFKPRGLDRDAFKSLQVLAVDDVNKRFFFISDGKAYIATIPQ